MTLEHATTRANQDVAQTHVDEDHVRLNVDYDSPDPDSYTSDATARGTPSPLTDLAASLRSQGSRIRIARVRDDFEQTLLIFLTLNVIYMYYIDHKLLVLLIRACQVIRLLHFPYASEASHRGTLLLLIVSNLPVLFIHKMLFSGPNVDKKIGQMLFINFIGPEPKSLAKILAVDFLIMILQAMLLQCKWEWEPHVFSLLTALPVPISDSFGTASQQRAVEDATQAQAGEPREGDNMMASAAT